MSRTQLLSGMYTATPSPDQSLLVMPRQWKRDQSRRLVIVIHGAGGRATSNSSGGYLWALTSAIADQLGLPCLSIDAGADATAGRPNNWSNANCLTAITNAFTWATGAAANYLDYKPGGKATKVGLIGVSMGGTAILNWAARNTGSVQFYIAVVPAADVDWAYGANAGATDIETAFGGTGSTLTIPGRGLYSGATAYVVNDFVTTAGGRWFRCILGTTGNAPPASGANTWWSETLWSSAGDFAATSFNPTKNTAPLAAAGIPGQLWWTGNDNTVVPISGSGVIPPIFTTYKTAVGASLTTKEIHGNPTHALAAPTLGANAQDIADLLTFVAANQ